MRDRYLLIFVAALIALAGCSTREPEQAGAARPLISDAAHGAGVAGVWFLPPMVSKPVL
jgi:hypothetical protein